MFSLGPPPSPSAGLQRDTHTHTHIDEDLTLGTSNSTVTCNKISNGVEKVVEELVCILLLHIVKCLWEERGIHCIYRSARVSVDVTT